MSTNPICDTVAERVALGEPLGEHEEHAGHCARCKLVVEMPAKLGATKHEIDPGLGFAARMTVGAQQRVTQRRRRRVAAALGTTVAAGLVAVFFVTRPPAAEPTNNVSTEMPVVDPTLEPATDAELKALVDLADVERSAHLSANWRQIKKPLSPYRKLLQGVVTP
ncbi:MAG: hypothetical protein H0T46_01680 [Deltaproteobacteria bacterium]|nr:hypothetical protein [Deltaproteobacteria bacterium]